MLRCPTDKSIAQAQLVASASGIYSLELQLLLLVLPWLVKPCQLSPRVSWSVSGARTGEAWGNPIPLHHCLENLRFLLFPQKCLPPSRNIYVQYMKGYGLCLKFRHISCLILKQQLEKYFTKKPIVHLNVIHYYIAIFYTLLLIYTKFLNCLLQMHGSI